jgi:hypothetical protein
MNTCGRISCIDDDFDVCSGRFVLIPPAERLPNAEIEVRLFHSEQFEMKKVDY